MLTLSLVPRPSSLVLLHLRPIPHRLLRRYKHQLPVGILSQQYHSLRLNTLYLAGLQVGQQAYLLADDGLRFKIFGNARNHGS